MKRAVLVALVGALALVTVQAAGPTKPASLPTDALSFFKNYIITGDYAVAGVGLRGQGVNGIASGRIEMRDVPAGVDIAAAFLYWQVVAKDSAGADAGSLPVTFRGRPLQSADGPFGRALGAGTAPCWSSGGGTGSSGGAFKTYSYRADVLRLFDIDEATGKFVVNGTHDVQLPDGNGLSALGASLVIVYRDSSLPLSAIVMYDGGYTMDQSTEGMSQRIEGFYQAASPAARLTHIVGSGQANKSERLLFNDGLIATNPFQSLQGESWDNVTIPVTSPTTRTSVTTSADREGLGTFDCLTWNAIIYRTEVRDSDGDGLLDVWETNRSTSEPPLVDPKGQPLPYLGDMGANPAIKDVFFEIGYMDTASTTFYGGVSKPAHSHLPTHEALKLVGDAFKNAPEPIAAHFDVGAGYPAGDLLVPSKNAEEYLVRGSGGERISESSTVCTRAPADPPWVCQFSDYPGTVGWKTGFRYLRDEVLSVTPPAGVTAPPPGEDFCDTPGYTCNRRFDEVRRQMFHYVLFAHAIALPKSEEPCLDTNNVPVPGNSSTGLCATPLRDNPDFHVPRTNTGVGDFPGGDKMVTLGAFNDIAGLPIGTPFMQASTLLHEFGHNAERRHGGEPFAPNCTPTYLSVMNYLYQLRGLLDDAGKPHLDFSRSAISPSITETSVLDGSHSALPYRIGWYAPLENSYLEGISQPVARHCDGTSLLPTDAATVRFDNRTAALPIDWNANGTIDDTAFALDVNFNGRRTRMDGSPDVLAGSNDWANLVLNQIGSRRNTGGLYVDAGKLALGPLSLDSGRGDLGRGDLGRGDLGRGDLGRGDLGRGDLGRGDLGRGDLGRGDLGNPALGRGDLGRGDLGGGDMFVNDPNNPSGELDFETAIGTAKAPPNEFTACIIGVDCEAQTTPLHDVRLDWQAPHVGDIARYLVYRVDGPTLLPGATWFAVADVTAVTGQASYFTVDGESLKPGSTYTYFAIASYKDGTQSDPSNLVTITAVNDAPVAVADSYSTLEGAAIVVAAPGVLANDSDSDSGLTASLVSGPTGGTLQLNADGSFTYTPAAGFYGTDTFTYAANDGFTSTAATVTIQVNRTVYGFVAVQNLPPPAGKTFKLGSAVPLRWQFTQNDAVFDSAAARPEITVVSSTGVVIYRGHPGDPGSSSFQAPTAANGYTWQFNWQTKAIVAGTYKVYVGSLRTGQTFETGKAFGGFPITLK